MIKKVKNNTSWTYVIEDISNGKNVGTFYQKGLQKNKSKRVQIKKVITKRVINLRKSVINFILTGEDWHKNYCYIRIEPYSHQK